MTLFGKSGGASFFLDPEIFDCLKKNSRVSNNRTLISPIFHDVGHSIYMLSVKIDTRSLFKV